MANIVHGLTNLFAGGGATAGWNNYTANKVHGWQNLGFQNAANQYNNYINSNAGMNGQKQAADYAKKETEGMADRMTAKQSAGANKNALKAAVSTNTTKGRAADIAANAASQNYENNYVNNYNAQLAQQNNLMNSANQQLANQLNAQGSLMGAHLTNDQSEYQQAWNNQSQGSRMNAGGGFHDFFSDEKLKDKTKVGLDGEEDIRMAHYKRCGEKLKHMNPNKWNELKWEAR